MHPQSDSLPNPPARLGELLTMAAVFSLLLAAQLVLTDSLGVCVRKLMPDELLTRARVTDPSREHFLRALAAAGFDCTPPTYYLVQRAVVPLLGGSEEWSLRGLSMLATVAALVGVYALVRRWTEPEVALAAGLVVAAHPLTIELAFMARCYALELAATVWYAYFLDRACTAGRNPVPSMAVALLAVVVCTTHWFGVLGLGLVTVAQVAARVYPWRAQLRAVAPALLGPLALLACLPILVRQRAVYTTPSWIPATNLPLILGFLGRVFPGLLLGICLAGYLLMRLLEKYLPSVRSAKALPLPWRPLAGLLGLLLLPVLLILLSLALFPVLGAIYSLPTVAALGAGVGVLFARAPRMAVTGLSALLFLTGAHALRQFHSERMAYEARVDRIIRCLRDEPAEGPIVFEETGELYDVCHYAPDVAGRCVYFQFEDTRPGELNPAFRHERELVQDFKRWYGGPRVVRFDSLKSLPRFLVVAVAGSSPARLEEDYPGRDIRRIEGDIFLITARKSLARTMRRGLSRTARASGGLRGQPGGRAQMGLGVGAENGGEVRDVGTTDQALQGRGRRRLVGHLLELLSQPAVGLGRVGTTAEGRLVSRDRPRSIAELLQAQSEVQVRGGPQRGQAGGAGEAVGRLAQRAAALATLLIQGQPQDVLRLKPARSTGNGVTQRVLRGPVLLCLKQGRAQGQPTGVEVGVEHGGFVQHRNRFRELAGRPQVVGPVNPRLPANPQRDRLAGKRIGPGAVGR